MKSTRLADSDLKITETGLASGSRLADRDSVLLLVRGSELHKRIPMGIAGRPVAFNQDVKALKAKEGLLPTYLLYWLLSNEPLLLSIVEYTGIGAGKLDTDMLKGLPLRLPPDPEQHAIVDILTTLDEKIHLNQAMNKTLEAMSQAIFKSWFVDFDPVHAMAEGRQPVGMDSEAADLITDRFEDLTTGRIPAGWSVEPMDEVAHFLNGLALQKYPPVGEEFLPVIKIAELRQGVTGSSDRASTGIPSQYIVEDGDVLFSWSGSLEVQLWSGGRGALNQHLFKVTSERYPKWFYYYWIKQHLPEFRAIAADKATTMGHIKRQHLTEALAVVPPEPILRAMSATMEPLISKMLNNKLEARTLAGIRDALLPKLISGEILTERLSQRQRDGVN
jgi:type I restriction enzyme S subunit